MGRARPDLIQVLWENPPGPGQAVTLVRRHRGGSYERYVPPRGYVTQIEGAAILGKSVMTVNRYVRSGELKDVTRNGISMIRLNELLRFRKTRRHAR